MRSKACPHFDFSESEATSGRRPANLLLPLNTLDALLGRSLSPFPSFFHRPPPPSCVSSQNVLERYAQMLVSSYRVLCAKIGLHQPSVNTTLSSSSRTGSSARPRSMPPRRSQPSSSTRPPRSRRSPGIRRRTPSPPTPSSPAGSSAPSSSQSPISSSSVAERPGCSRSTRTGRRPESGSNSEQESPRR